MHPHRHTHKQTWATSMPPRGCRFPFPAVRFCLDYFMLKVARRRQPSLPRTTLPIHSLLFSYPTFFSYSRLVHVAPVLLFLPLQSSLHSKSISSLSFLLLIFYIVLQVRAYYPYISFAPLLQLCLHQFIPSSNSLPSQFISLPSISSTSLSKNTREEEHIRVFLCSWAQQAFHSSPLLSFWWPSVFRQQQFTNIIRNIKPALTILSVTINMTTNIIITMSINTIVEYSSSLPSNTKSASSHQELLHRHHHHPSRHH